MLNQAVISTIQPIEGVRLGVDKVVLGIPLAKNGKKDFATKFHLESEIYESIHNRQIKKTGKAGSSALVGRYFNPTNNKCILTIVVGTIWGKPYCQFGFNPNNLNEADWLTIQEILCTCFDYGLSHLLNNAVIRKLELSLDFDNVPSSDLVVMAAGIKSGATNCKGTRYCGQRKSPLSVATYDKAKQLAECNGIVVGHDLTRVEARLVLSARTLLDLAEGKVRNPWERIFRACTQGAPRSVREILVQWSRNGGASPSIRAATLRISSCRQEGPKGASPAPRRVCVSPIRSEGCVGSAFGDDSEVLPCLRRSTLYSVSGSDFQAG